MAVDYDTLTGSKTTVGSIMYLANHTDLPVENILIEAQALIYQSLRVQDMLVTAEVSIAEGDDHIAKPTRFLAVEWLMLDGAGRPLEYVHEGLLNRRKDSNGDLWIGQPKRFALVNDQFEFDVQADDDYAGDICFYQQPANLSTGAGNTNFLTDRFPTLLTRACMAFAWAARNRADMYAEALTGPLGVDTLIDKANASADLARRGQRLV